MSHNFIRVPPDSTGKRILTAERRVVTYDQLQSGQTFSVGDVWKETNYNSVDSSTGKKLSKGLTKGQALALL